MDSLFENDIQYIKSKFLKPYLELNSKLISSRDASDKVYEAKCIVLKNYGDTTIRSKFICNKLFVIDCDKNFVYYTIHKGNFPNTKELYLASHPCDSIVFYHFD